MNCRDRAMVLIDIANLNSADYLQSYFKSSNNVKGNFKEKPHF